MTGEDFRAIDIVEREVIFPSLCILVVIAVRVEMAQR